MLPLVNKIVKSYLWCILDLNSFLNLRIVRLHLPFLSNVMFLKFFNGVYFFMLSQIRARSKVLMAHIARVGFITRVDALVPNQVACLKESKNALLPKKKPCYKRRKRKA
jgi:hypothetical protein